MTIEKNLEETKLTLKLDGRLDTTTAPMLEDEIKLLLPVFRRLNWILADLRIYLQQDCVFC